MILSHKHRFIFLKTKKTASSSVELTLSSLCGPDDVITPLLDREEKLRPGRGAQNYLRGDAERERTSNGMSIPVRGQDFYGHMKASEVVAIAPAEWANYFKAAFVRNPWDAHLSAFFWRRRKGGDRSPEARELVARRCAAAIEAFGYEFWQGPAGKGDGIRFRSGLVTMQFEGRHGRRHRSSSFVACSTEPVAADALYRQKNGPCWRSEFA
jgi:hypothetical protein